MSFLNFFKKQKVPKYSEEQLSFDGGWTIENFEKTRYIFNGFLVLNASGEHTDIIRHYVPLTDGVIYTDIIVEKANESSRYFQMGFRYEVKISIPFKTGTSTILTIRFLHLKDANQYADKMAELLQTCKNQKN